MRSCAHRLLADAEQGADAVPTPIHHSNGSMTVVKGQENPLTTPAIAGA